MVANPVIEGISQDRCYRQEKQNQRQIERAQSRKRAGRKEQRVTGQKRRHHQTRFAKDNQKENQIGPGTVGFNHYFEVVVEM